MLIAYGLVKNFCKEFLYVLVEIDRRHTSKDGR